MIVGGVLRTGSKVGVMVGVNVGGNVGVAVGVSAGGCTVNVAVETCGETGAEGIFSTVGRAHAVNSQTKTSNPALRRFMGFLPRYDVISLLRAAI